jgi:threonine dehydrogenase-like Zn-dependent dehydrogenase
LAHVAVTGTHLGYAAYMKALTVIPGHPGSATLSELPEPEPSADRLLVRGLALGVCGTDREIVRGEYGWAPPGRDQLVLGHESLGRVLHAPDGSDFAVGDLVVGVVRRPDPEPCGACARGEFDMCRNGRYTERGIKEIDGYGSELWTVEPAYAVKLDPKLERVGVLMEPTSVVAKAWEQIEHIGRRSWFEPQKALVTGAGPIGLLAALIGVQRGLEVHVLDRVTAGPKPKLVEKLGAAYHHGDAAELAARINPDIIVEATGVGQLVFDAMSGTNAFGIVCLTGVSPVDRKLSVDAGAINRELVLENDAVFGSVNANQRHYRQAAEALAAADAGWLDSLITRRVALAAFEESQQ